MSMKTNSSSTPNPTISTSRPPSIPFAQANALAASLAQLMDDVERQGCDLGKLETLAPESFAQHWNDVAEFLKILRDQWPDILIAEKRANPIARRNELQVANRDRHLRRSPAKEHRADVGTRR